VSTLGAASLGAASWLDSVVGSGAIEGAVLDEDELQAPTKRAAPRMRMATRDFNGHVLLEGWGPRPPYEQDLHMRATASNRRIAAA
jgi:hypothetical protein